MVFRIVDENIEDNETPQQNVSQEQLKPKFKIIDEAEINESSKEEKIAKSFRFFGYQPSPETIKKIRHPIGVSLKGFSKGLIGAPGELLSLAQRLMGIKDPKKILPSSEDVGNFFERLSGEEFNPENLTEEFADKGFEFFGSLISLGGPLKGATLGSTIGRNILASFAPGAVSVVGEKLNLPPWVKAASTIGTSYLSHRLTGKSLKDMEKALYSQARSLSKDAKVPAKTLSNNIKALSQRLKKGGIEGSDKEALRKIADIQKTIKNGQLSIEDAMSLKQKINEARGQLFAKDLGKVGMKSARRNLNSVSKKLDEAISSYKNPEFQQAYKQANQLHAGQAETNKIFHFIKNHVPSSAVAASALKYIIPTAITKGAPFVTAAQTGLFLKSLTKYPGYRKAYFNVLKNASKEEVRGTLSSINKLIEEKKKIDKKEKYKIVSQ